MVVVVVVVVVVIVERCKYCLRKGRVSPKSVIGDRVDIGLKTKITIETMEMLSALILQSSTQLQKLYQ